MNRCSWILFFCAVLALQGGCSRETKKTRHVRSADRYFNAGRWDKAEVEYLNAVRLDARDATVLGRLGAMYLEQGRYERAFASRRNAKARS